MQYFTYLWLDKARHMFYIGMHEGTIEDGYISSSRWFNGEQQYRPNDFIRKILKTFDDRASARKEEARLLAMIKDSEFGKKYYNLKNGRRKGTPASNKGKPMSLEQRKKLSLAKLGKPSPTKGKHSPKSANNGRIGASKLSATVTGRKRKYLPDGSWTWEYPISAS